MTLEILPALTGLSQALRGLAIFAGVILILDLFKIYAGVEKPVHNPKANARAWGLVSLGSIFGGSYAIGLGHFPTSLTDSFSQTVTAFWMWLCLAAGLVDRAAIRSLRPSFIYASSIMFTITGTALFLWGA